MVIKNKHKYKFYTSAIYEIQNSRITENTDKSNTEFLNVIKKIHLPRK